MSSSRLLLASLVAALPLCASSSFSFSAQGTDPGPWVKVFEAIGMPEAKLSGPKSPDPAVIILGPNERLDILQLATNHLVIVEGTGIAAQSLGFRRTGATVSIRQICDIHAPKTQIIWEQPLAMPAVEMPASFTVLATEKWKGMPVVAGLRYPHGGVLWVAADPGPSGMERFPYLLQAAVDLGLNLPVRTANLWAFFDSAYRIHADVDYLAQRWRKAGISTLHVAGWHNMEPDGAQDDYLRNLIAACHRNAILVYAWLELPHVSEKFWAIHPEWREKTAVGQDAQLDWRKLMNLQNAECRREVEKQVGGLLQRFDWDGVNVAELYFESLEGAANPARFTPMNDDVRADFKREAGFDPQLIFSATSPYSAGKNPEALRRFLDYRAGLAAHMQSDWLGSLLQLRANKLIRKPYLDIVLTHIDDRFEPGIRDALGADVARSLPVVKAAGSTLLVEDPATLWGLGPERYGKLARKYAELTPDRKQIAVDINVVDRYQEVYPTKKQTGTELLQLVHQAAAAFSKVALYFENSIEKQDLDLLPAAATSASVIRTKVDELQVSASETTRVNWQGPVEIDGKAWPLQSENSVLTPAGRHQLRPGLEQPAVALSDFNGDLQSAMAGQNRVDVSYFGHSRAIASIATPVSLIEVDGAPLWKSNGTDQIRFIMLPAGQHVVSFTR